MKETRNLSNSLTVYRFAGDRDSAPDRPKLKELAAATAALVK
jgi:hypothetical protein